MAQRKLRHDSITVSPAGPLALHVALVYELGEDPMSGALGDAYRSGDVAQADSRVMSHAQEDMGVVGQKAPAGVRGWRTLLLISRKVIHELMIDCT